MSAEGMLIASLVAEITTEAKRVWGESDRIYASIEIHAHPTCMRWRACAYGQESCEPADGDTATEAARALLDRLAQMPAAAQAAE